MEFDWNSVRSEVVFRRTYSRPDENGNYETWAQTVDRVVGHQKWLWERALGRELNVDEKNELAEFRKLQYEKKISVSGRTLWLGGTEVSKKREASQFNCSFTEVETVYDVVDVLWLLMQGCGVGFKPVVGTLNGFTKPIENIEVIRSKRTNVGGLEHNVETWDSATKTWTIKVGDSAEAWSKSVGKILAGKYPADKLVFDFSELRPAGIRLKGYGWISSGDENIAKAFVAISKIMNKRAGQLLRKMDILDIVNWLGTILSSRRSAEIALFEYGEPEWKEFAIAKKEWWNTGNEQRVQSNNSLLFKTKPSKEELKHLFDLMVDSGGSEPGFINQQTALSRAPWFKGCNPCAEILLGNKSFCNLVEINLSAFKGDTAGLHNAIRIAARANYRQTCVDLRDGILQEAWHLNNEFLRLCGVGITGIATRDDLVGFDYRQMERVATASAYEMADELGLQRPKNVTTVKPSGTLSKLMGTTEGVHKPMGKYIFNNINFSKHDPIVQKLIDAGFRHFENPVDSTGVIVTLPIKWDGVEFDKVGKDGEIMYVNLESAIDQLERYKLIQTNYTQQNTSVTISYDVSEVDDIVDWIINNWESYVGVSFIFRADPTKSAKDLGYLYLPQEVVTEKEWSEYVSTLKIPKFDDKQEYGDFEISNQECEGGSCPVI